ncbi:hypothetical protein HETIRDRAFT_107270 [Heterobasidion irregulare TC 32-1]|uniref:Uncharacterized protein n=1 Tax=Heterobasidion irregulare (strain TC 32-1) TaxID=747525 RepID=W4KCT5_HETIT|nr:uncharacterized protein HETIRDRAFT_107270 [Heterobasidion irregulare TC 32-1]ETW83150.1 hypothetical protein HETIRDRAFT_107270 [Heterobasidion irregulare TC 32-1]
MQRAALPRFPIKLGDETFDRVYNYITKDLNYSGPLGLSCDNTKLLSTLRTYWDAQAECFFLVGHTGEPIPIADTAKLEALLKSETLEKATKVRVWCVQIPMPKASSIVAHVMAIPNSLSAENLQIYSDRIICGLDDNAVYQLFSASSLKYLSTHFPDHIGEIIYLFIFGELIDTYQNRSISHIARIKMVLRIRYFVDIWSLFIDQVGYVKSKHFISHEATNIICIIIEGLLGLIFVHRDHMGDERYPLLPWIHSSEVCEHVFAECRKLVKDFAFTDLIQMMPRLHVSIRAAVLLNVTTDPKARVAGYAHTYFDSHGINLGLLACFPLDGEIKSIAQDAWGEAANLFSILGVSPSDFLSASTSHPTLPSIDLWYAPGLDPLADTNLSDVDASDDERKEGDSDMGDADELDKSVKALPDSGICRHAVDKRLFNLECAAVAVNLEDLVRLREYCQELPPEEHEANLEKDRLHLLAALRIAQLPPIDVPPKPCHAFDFHYSLVDNLNFTTIIDIQRVHQTCRAAQGVRKNAVLEVSSSGSEKVAKETLQRQIIREMQGLLLQQEDRGIGSGLERKERWKALASRGLSSGNSANAALAAAQRAEVVRTSGKTSSFN